MSLMSGSQPGVPALGRRGPRASGALLQEPHRTGEIAASLLHGAHEISCALGPGQKQLIAGSLGHTYLLVLESLLERRGGAAAAHPGDTDADGGEQSAA